MRVSGCELHRASIARALAPWLVALATVGLAACSSASASQASKPVAPAPPPKDDGRASQSQSGTDDHSAVLEQLKVSPITKVPDNQRSILVPLPDAAHWTRVKFLTIQSLAGFRYGKEHHGIVGVFVTHVDDNTKEGACERSFEALAMPVASAFDVELRHDAPSAFSWTLPDKTATPTSPKKIAIVEVDSLYAKMATVLSRDEYRAAWSAYPAWNNACLVVGVAFPIRDDDERARAVRDRFVREILPNVTITSDVEPPKRY